MQVDARLARLLLRSLKVPRESTRKCVHGMSPSALQSWIEPRCGFGWSAGALARSAMHGASVFTDMQQTKATVCPNVASDVGCSSTNNWIERVSIQAGMGFAIDFQPLAWRFRTWQPKSDLVMCTRVQAIWCISADAPMQGHIMARCRTAVCSPDATGRRTPSGSSVDVVLDGTGHGWWGRCCSNCMILCTWQSRWLQRQDTMNVQPLDVSA